MEKPSKPSVVHAEYPEDEGHSGIHRSDLKRKCIDFHNTALIDLGHRLYRRSSSCRSSAIRMHLDTTPLILPHSSYIRFLSLPISDIAFPNTAMVHCSQLAHVTRAKNSNPVMCLSWTPGGRRVLTGNQEGEFTLWDGVTFSFELIMSAHDSSFRCMAWSHNSNYLLTSDASGNIKYWSPSIAPVQSIDSHQGQPIHGLSFSPSDTKFVSCGDDATVRVWDWALHKEERVLEGHGWDVKCVQWHPRSSVVASGSKDNLVKLWDPRSGGTAVSSLYGHKNTVTKLAWNDNGNWLLTGSRDQMLRLYDIRAMRELYTLKGHYKEVTSLVWHPIYETVFASGGMDGTMLFWNVGVKSCCEEPQARIPFAHDMAIWDMRWHPAGHCLATGSNDRQTKFWCRTRPGSAGASSCLAEDSTKTASSNPTSDLLSADQDEGESEILIDEMELGNHVGIVIGRRGATIISMQRATGTKMHVDQIRRVLEIQGTQKQINTVKKRVGALLERVSQDNEQRGVHH